MIDNLALYIILAIAVAFLLLKCILFVHPYIRRSSLPRYLQSSSHDKSGRSWAMVTGASDGIGLAFAHELAHRGFNVVLHGRNVSKLRAAEISLKQENPNLELRIVIIDALQSKDDLKVQLASMVDTLGDIHLRVLVNNVGGNPRQPPFKQFEEETLDYMEDVIQMNAKFPIQITSAVLPLLLRHKNPSLVINIGSFSQGGSPWLSVYAGSKAFNMSWSKSLQMEMQGEGHPVEVLGIIVGVVTSVAHRKRSPTFFVPTSRAMASAALDKVGCGRMTVVGYFPHALQSAVVSVLPEWLLRTVMIGASRAEKIALEKKV